MKSCQITNKTSLKGNTISHSQQKTRRRFMPNLQTKKLINPATGQTMKLTLSTSAMRTLAKWDAAGKKYDLRKIIADAK